MPSWPRRDARRVWASYGCQKESRWEWIEVDLRLVSFSLRYLYDMLVHLKRSSFFTVGLAALLSSLTSFFLPFVSLRVLRTDCKEWRRKGAETRGERDRPRLRLWKELVTDVPEGRSLGLLSLASLSYRFATSFVTRYHSPSAAGPPLSHSRSTRRGSCGA